MTSSLPETDPAVTTPLSPMQEYEAKFAVLMRLLAATAPESNDRAVLDEAVNAWSSRNFGHAQMQEQRYRTRYYCGICYGEIPQMADVPMRGGQQRAHRVCEHLYLFDMPTLRNQIRTQAFDHNPQAPFHGRATCPVLSDGWPTMHPKRSSFEEPRR